MRVDYAFYTFFEKCLVLGLVWRSISLLEIVDAVKQTVAKLSFATFDQYPT